MNTSENITPSGRFTVTHIRNGQVLSETPVKNTVVTVGKNALAAWLTTSQASGFMPYAALGTGTTAATVSDTALGTQVGSRALGTLSSSTNVYSNSSTHTFSSSYAITEAGLFSASSGGTMFARQVFSPVNVLSGDQLIVNWSVTFS